MKWIFGHDFNDDCQRDFLAQQKHSGSLKAKIKQRKQWIVFSLFDFRLNYLA
ncbi:hypothetical protein [Alysiella filiformis]|uniref:hypothetical protein n=1 Tax=Alysiella filiformis TaxID=194196 RepID=UPI0015C73387|nr:hypothetical protein [Alysiella filiformis]QMT32166.1 hypothetical protein H3L97_04820 [Alysiella filiformis]UBQ56914.1 hypothetical protein JF568_03855 [Alysiella filiformis DSM 16848]